MREFQHYLRRLKAHIILLLMAALLTFAGPAHSQNCFPVYGNKQLSIKGSVYDMKQAGGKLYLGGQFSGVGVHTGNLLIVDSNGNDANPILDKFNGTIHAVMRDRFGGWYIAGKFDYVGDSARNNIAYIDASGKVTGWQMNTNDAVLTIAISNDTLFFGGNFTSVNGLTRYGLAAARRNGTLLSFSPLPQYGYVKSILIAQKQLFVGGSFTLASGKSHICSFSLPSLALTNLSLNAYIYGSVSSVAHDGNLVFIAGLFINNFGTARIATYNLISNTISYWNNIAYKYNGNNLAGYPTVICAGNGKLFCFGQFDSINNVPRKGYAAFDTATKALTSWAPQTNSGWISALHWNKNKVRLGGNNLSFGGGQNQYYAIVNDSNGSYIPSNIKPDAPVSFISSTNDSIIIGGIFSTSLLIPRTNLMAIDTASGEITPWAPVANHVVNSIAYKNGFIFIAGSFSMVNDSNRNIIAALDTITGAVTAWKKQFSSTASYYSKLIEMNDWLYAAGGGGASGVTYPVDAISIANGTSKPGWSVNTNGYINSLSASNSAIYVGGNFQQMVTTGNSSTSTTGLAKVWINNCRIAPWITKNTTNVVNDIKVYKNRVYVSGNFSNIYNPSANNNLFSAVVTDTGNTILTNWKPLLNNQSQIPQMFSGFRSIEVTDYYVLMGMNTNSGTYIATFDTSTGKMLGWNANGALGISRTLVSGKKLYVAGTTTYGKTGSAGIGQYDLNGKPKISSQPKDIRACFGSYSSMSIAVESLSPFRYQWRKMNANIGSNSPSLTFSSLTFADTGWYVCYIFDSCGFQVSDTARVIVYPNPTGNFNVNNPNQCVNSQNFTFTPNASSNVTLYEWNFGNNSTSNQQTPSNQYANAGQYTVSLNIRTQYNCSYDTSMSIVVYPKPNPHFAINDSFQCFKTHQYSFNDNSNISSGNFSRQWYFSADSSTVSDSVSLSKKFNRHGLFTALLRLTSNNGCKDSLSKTFRIAPSPNAFFTVNDSSQCFGNVFIFPNMSSIDTGTMTFRWRVGNTLLGQNQSFSYHPYSYGNYQVKLNLVSDLGCTDSSSRNIVALPVPASNFTINKPLQCLKNNQFIINNNTNPAQNNDSTRYYWSFGAGLTSNLKNPQVQYPIHGTYQMQLVAESSKGCTDTSYRFITIYPSPVTQFSINDSDQCLVGNRFEITNTSTIASGVLNYNWHISNGFNSTSRNVAPSFNSPGTYVVKLVSESNNSCIDSAVKLIYVRPMPVSKIHATANSLCAGSNNFTFTDSSSINNGAMAYTSWEINGANISSSSVFMHTFATPGMNNVKLTNGSDYGCMDDTLVSILIHPSPTSTIQLNNSQQCINNQSLEFISNSTLQSGMIIQHAWVFSPGNNTMNGQRITPTFNLPGVYQVQLITTSDKGCRDTMETTFKLMAAPLASFTVNNPQQCQKGNEFSFTNNTPGHQTLSHQWQVASIKDTSTHFIFSAPAPDKYYIRLVEMNKDGCRDTATRIIETVPSPISTGVFGQNTPPAYKTILYSVNGSNTSTYYWNVTGGTLASSNGKTAYIKWDAPIIGNVKVVETNNYGCSSDTFSMGISVLATNITKAQISDAELTIYPNPAHYHLTITLKNKKEFNVSIFNMVGQQIFSVHGEDGIVEIETDKLARGVYLVKVQAEGINYTGKVILR